MAALNAFVCLAILGLASASVPLDTGSTGDNDEAIKTCAELCAEDEGMDKETCATECAVHTDNTDPEWSRDEGLRGFVADKVDNEQTSNQKDGAPAMAVAHEKISGEEQEQFECVPTVSPTDEPTFKDLDFNGDGEISKPEAYAFGEKMCEPNERVNDIFTMADRNADGFISKDEFNIRGENTSVEQGIDATMDRLTPGDDEYAECNLPPFRHFDEDKNGYIAEWELAKAVEFELNRRTETPGPAGSGMGGLDTADPARKEAFRKIQDMIMEEARAQFQEADTDEDGRISEKEFEAAGKEEDMGDQFEEQAKLPEDEGVTDLDDLSVEKPQKAANFLQSATNEPLARRFLVAQHDEASFLAKFQGPVVKSQPASTGGGLCRLWSKGMPTEQ